MFHPYLYPNIGPREFAPISVVYIWSLLQLSILAPYRHRWESTCLCFTISCYTVVNAGTTYTVLTGYPRGDRAAAATPSSFVCLASGTLCGLADGARAEHMNSKVAVNEIYLRCIVHKEVSQTSQVLMWGHRQI